MTHDFILNNGVSIPSIGFGTWKAGDGAEAIDAVSCALATGYRHIDCAAAYVNERSVGKAIRLSGVPRNKLFVTSKVWNTERGFDSTLRSFDKSAADLGLDYLDLYLIHWPASAHQFENWRSINRDTWRALERLYAEGRVRAIGVSNFMPHHLEPLMADATVPPAVNQIEYHPGFTQPECVEFCDRHEIRVEAWSPLGRGRIFKNPTLIDIATHHGKSVAQICLRWELQHGIVPLPKSVTPTRIKENLDEWDYTLTAEEMSLIDALPMSGESGLDPDKIDF